MKTFLEHVAQDLLERHSGDLSNVSVIFPNKRARLFLNEALLTLTPNPIWEPRYQTIGELFQQISGATVADPIPTITTLYSLYRQHMANHADETIDQFWAWGEILLSDFDDIDKHLVNADILFANARDLAHMDSIDFLEPDQLSALNQFFASFTPENKTRIQQRFIDLWSIMPHLYHDLKPETSETLKPLEPFEPGKLVFPYEGSLHRSVVENKQLLSTIPNDREYCFVGFNMLSQTDRKLMLHLHRRHQARFYWDYDNTYLNDPHFEAGDFMRQNLKDFPNQLQTHPQLYDNLTHSQGFTFVSTTTDSIGSRYIPTWLSDHLTPTERETALVLCDENQLETILHSIPDTGPSTPHEVNVTMGFPLRNTPIYSFLVALITLQTEGWDSRRNRFRRPFIKTLQSHPYIVYLTDPDWNRHIDTTTTSSHLIEYLDEIVLKVASSLLPLCEEGTTLETLYIESIHTTHKTLQQFLQLTTDTTHPLHLQPVTLRRLLKRALTSQSIPFHGEPASGLQIMGVLETRCLDFRNILMLNVGEGFFPKNQSDSSLIPQKLRTGFHLTTIRHRIAVYAYYFYRLIQRAQHVTFIYNEHSSDNTKREMSRFLRQLQAETHIPIRTIRLEASQHIHPFEFTEIPKPSETSETPETPESPLLTPTTINSFLNCSMQYYFSHICHLRVNEEQEEAGAKDLGKVFHGCMHQIYYEITTHTHGTITREAISTYLADNGTRLQPIINHQFQKEAQITDFRGENILVRNVVERYVQNMLRYDLQHTPFTIDLMEQVVDMPIQVDGHQLRIGGFVDRIDILTAPDSTEYHRILDYKTGGHIDTPATLSELFTPDSTHSGYFLQAFLYAIAARHKRQYKGAVKPVLFYVNHASHPDYDPTLVFKGKRGEEPHPVNDITDFEQDFLDGLRTVLHDMSDPAQPYRKTANLNTCTLCEFKTLCGR